MERHNAILQCWYFAQQLCAKRRDGLIVLRSCLAKHAVDLVKNVILADVVLSKEC
jgi:hypothetical protein